MEKLVRFSFSKKIWPTKITENFQWFLAGFTTPTRKLNHKFQCQFEINQFLFRETNQDELPILEGEDEDLDEERQPEENDEDRLHNTEGENNPNYETQKTQS